MLARKHKIRSTKQTTVIEAAQEQTRTTDTLAGRWEAVDAFKLTF
jgi:hypothetical protein